jgi:hypothetical protein
MTAPDRCRVQGAHAMLFRILSIGLLGLAPAASASTSAIVIDHTSIALFEQIPEQYVTAARNTRLLFSDRSVGQNIHEALDCLTATAWYYAPASCRRDYYSISGSAWLWKTYSKTDYESGLVPARIRFEPDPVKYDRSNWTFELRAGAWQELIQGFVQELVPTYAGSKDVLSFQFSYLNIDQGSTIDDDGEGLFTDQPHHGYYANGIERWDISDLEGVEAQHPDKRFIYWTTSLARASTSRCGSTRWRVAGCSSTWPTSCPMTGRTSPATTTGTAWSTAARTRARTTRMMA